MKLHVHLHQRAKFVTLDRAIEIDEGRFHRGNMYRLRALGAERGAIAFEDDARLEHVLQLSQAEFGNYRADTRATIDETFERQPLQRVAQ